MTDSPTYHHHFRDTPIIVINYQNYQRTIATSVEPYLTMHKDLRLLFRAAPSNWTIHFLTEREGKEERAIQY